MSDDAAATQPATRNPASAVHRRLRLGYFTLESLNALASSLYLNYLFFYMRDHFGFGNRDNLLLTALYGIFCTVSAWNAGRFAERHGYIRSLRLGFIGMGLALVLGALAPRVFGYSHIALAAQCVLLILWSLSLCVTWPTLQALVSREAEPGTLPRTAGIYNMIWAGNAALAYLAGGALLQKFGGETLFWLPAGLHVVQLFLLARLQKISAAVAAPSVAESAAVLPPVNPHPVARARTFLYLAWLANPFAYLAIYGLLPVIPKLSEHLGLDHAHAGMVCSVWFWVRLGAFVTFWLWPGWHYRFGWLLGAFVALAASFTAILLSSQIWMLVAAQVVFGVAVGLIYYSSLFYSMDLGASQGRSGGIHEAAIGLGTFAGPAVGVIALLLLPGSGQAGTWSISSVLFLGLVPFLIIHRRGRA